jgi:hypothetical protein
MDCLNVIDPEELLQALHSPRPTTKTTPPYPYLDILSPEEWDAYRVSAETEAWNA